MSLLSLLAALSSAQAWEHSGLVLSEPLELELTTVDPQGTSPGQMQQAMGDAFALWADDACLTSLPEVSVVSTDDNVFGVDGRNTVSADASGYGTLTSLLHGDEVFDRHGVTYSRIDEVDIDVGATSWATPAEVEAGMCSGSVITRSALEVASFALGMSRPEAAEATSLFGQPECSVPTLGPDDRAGLRALYGSGITWSCEVSATVILGFGDVAVESICQPETYGDSELLDLVLVEDGTALEPGAPLTEPGIHHVEACGTFAVPDGCDQAEVCAPHPAELLVCETPTPTLTAELHDATVVLVDTTELTDERCIAEREWSVAGIDAPFEVTEPGRELTLERPDQDEMEVTLTLVFGPNRFETTTVVSLLGPTPPGPHVPMGEGEAQLDAQGCGCASDGPVGLGAVGLGRFGRRR